MIKTTHRTCMVTAVLLAGSLASGVAGASPTEMELARAWVAQHFGEQTPAAWPFSFVYGDRPSAELLGGWKTERTSRPLDGNRTEIVRTWADANTGLAVTCRAISYADFPTVEWTLYFKNTAAQDTPIIADVQPLDVTLRRGSAGEFTLQRTVGDGGANIFMPEAIALAPGQERRLAPEGGRPCSGEFPYFNVEWPEGGRIVAIGWPGQWAARFARDGSDGLRVVAGQELTRFKLLPGEELRTPLIVMQFWTSDRSAAQNVWRKWMRAHNLPRPGGQPLPPQMNVCNGNQFGYWGITEDNQRAWIDRYAEEGIAYDYWWCDLSWFAIDTNTLVFNGLYDPDPVRFPRGLKSLSDYLHTKHIKLIAWFEPEHYYPGPGNWLVEHHPEWLLKMPPGHENEINQGMPLKDRRVLNLGDPAALRWLTDNTDRVICEQGIDYYRHDFNVEPLQFWRNHDAPDRQGVTEIKYVTGFLAYYDGLLARHPGMAIDNCASGGRRNDVETLRRSVPLLRSDTWGEPVGQQCQSYGLNNWIPFWGTGILHADPKDVAYVFRSQMGPSFTSCWDLTAKGDYSVHRRLLEQWRSVRADMLNGDYYPLTPYSAAADAWMAWQFDRPETGTGFVQAFRRGASEATEQVYRLRGLDTQAQYAVQDLDTGQIKQCGGTELMDVGLRVALSAPPGAALVAYRRAKSLSH